MAIPSVDAMTILDNPDTVPAPPAGRYSHVAVIDLGARKLLVLSGQVAIDPDGRLVGAGDMTAQTEFIMDTIGAILAAHGATLAHIVNVRTYLIDMSLLAEYGAARARRFSAPMPTSTTVQVAGLFVPGALLEVEVTAVL
jgi:2-iminobutanoate/2-iminopropanoate deaminase